MEQNFWNKPIKDTNWKEMPSNDAWLILILILIAVFINFTTAYYCGLALMILRIIFGVLGKIMKNQETILKAIEEKKL
tara:strand:+ start:265 stop:498 length:234 start_codon:yes stop_codon:yes gene_type:complete